jgi:putative spermidine/putrescine transport system substrate-binding protein
VISRPHRVGTLFLLLALVLGIAPIAPPSTAAAQPVAPASTTDTRQFAGKTLNVALAPGRIDDLNKIVVPGFEQLTGAKVQLTGARSADALARVRIEKDRPTLDVVWIDIGEALLLGNEGLIAKVSETDVPNIAEIRDNAKLASGIAPITFSSALGFLWNKDLLKAPPASWAELWNPQYEGQLALFDLGSSVGVVTLVLGARLNGGSETDVEPGFASMQTLKPNGIGYKTSGPENNNLVAQGEAAVTFALANQTQDLQAKGANVDWAVPAEGAATLPQTFQVVTGAPEPDLAKAFVNYVLSTEIQTRLANELLLAVTNKNVVLDPAVAPLVPLDRLIYFDWETIGAKRGEWTNRFNREILGS